MPFSQRAPDAQNCYKPAAISNDTSLTLKIPLVARMVFQNLAMKDGTCAAAVMHPRTPGEAVAWPPSICLDTYMLCGVYQQPGICIRNHC
jgi:hypothetical protein